MSRRLRFVLLFLFFDYSTEHMCAAGQLKISCEYFITFGSVHRDEYIDVIDYDSEANPYTTAHIFMP